MNENLEEFEFFSWLDLCFDAIVDRVENIWGMLKNNNNTNISVHPEWDLASLQAWDFIVDLNELHLQLQKTISAAQTRYSASANKHRTPSPDFIIRDKVFVKSDHICTTRPSKKLVEKYLGPFKIIAQAGTHSFTLCLPSSMHAVDLLWGKYL